MSELDDHDLLARYARGNSEAAFAALAERHVNLVYSIALRSTGNPHAAEEITQAVFIILANKAEKLSRRVVLSGWLYQTTRLTAANFLRAEIRRQKREQEAYMESTLNEPDDNVWPQIAPLLDGALEKLGERDRNAIVLRFFENKNLREVGAALGASEDAAKMRVNRALEKLRKFFTKRGVTLSATAIAGAVSANSVQAAPFGLAKTISVVAIAKGATAGGSTLALVKGALKLMAWTKIQTAGIAAAIALLAIGTTVVTVKQIKKHEVSVLNNKIYNLGIVEISDGITSRHELGEGRVCVIKPTVKQDGSVLLAITIEEINYRNHARTLTHLNVSTFPDRSVEIEENHFGVSLTPHIKP